MYKLSIGERFDYLLERQGATVDDVAEKTGIARSYLYDLRKDQRKNPSADILEKIADYFGVSSGFFSQRPANYVPPVPVHQIHMALRSVGMLDEDDKAVLDSLIKRAQALAAKQQPGKNRSTDT